MAIYECPECYFDMLPDTLIHVCPMCGYIYDEPIISDTIEEAQDITAEGRRLAFIL